MANQIEGVVLDHLKNCMPLKIDQVLRLPHTNTAKVGLVIVDEVNGFAAVGSGNLEPNAQISYMVDETVRIARVFAKRGWPILSFLDTHYPDKPEDPYPPHCIIGTGEENLVPELAWLENEPNSTLVRKDCINGFVGAIKADGSNQFCDWVASNELEKVLVVGICTDVCVMDFVVTILSARNHDVLKPLKDVLVYTKGCATYSLSSDAAEAAGLGPHDVHPQDLTHYLGLYIMATRGALLVDAIDLEFNG